MHETVERRTETEKKSSHSPSKQNGISKFLKWLITFWIGSFALDSRLVSLFFLSLDILRRYCFHFFFSNFVSVIICQLSKYDQSINYVGINVVNILAIELHLLITVLFSFFSHICLPTRLDQSHRFGRFHYFHLFPISHRFLP